MHVWPALAASTNCEKATETLLAKKIVCGSRRGEIVGETVEATVEEMSDEIVDETIDETVDGIVADELFYLSLYIFIRLY